MQARYPSQHKNDKPEKKLHHEAWRKGNNKANFCGNVRLPYSQGKIVGQNLPLDLLGEKAMKEGIGRALEIFSGVKISLAIVFHLECVEVTKFQEFLMMVLRSKAQQESIIRSKRGKIV